MLVEASALRGGNGVWLYAITVLMREAAMKSYNLLDLWPTTKFDTLVHRHQAPRGLFSPFCFAHEIFMHSG